LALQQKKVGALDSLYWRIPILRRYVKKFGATAGFKMFWKFYHPFLKGEKIELVHIPFYDQPFGVRLKTSDVNVLEEVFIAESYDLNFLNLNPKIIIDAGANVGFSSIFLSHAYPQARIFAIEPEESNFQMLVKNTKSYPNIVPIHAALWPNEKKLQIANSSTEKWAFRIIESRKKETGETVGALTMNKLFLIAKTKNIDILKLDIEGSELDLFSENYDSWLGRINTIIIELHDSFRKGCSEVFYKATDHYNFQKAEGLGHVILHKNL